METTVKSEAGFSREGTNAIEKTSLSSHAYQAYMILLVGFTAAPIIAGVDKFTNVLVNWNQYLAPAVTNMLGGASQQFMYLVGVIEIVAGIGVFLKPKIFAYIVAAWLGLIIVNLFMIPGYFDVALRDLGLMLGALALGRLSSEFDKQVTGK